MVWKSYSEDYLNDHLENFDQQQSSQSDSAPPPHHEEHHDEPEQPGDVTPVAHVTVVAPTAIVNKPAWVLGNDGLLLASGNAVCFYLPPPRDPRGICQDAILPAWELSTGRKRPRACKVEGCGSDLRPAGGVHVTIPEFPGYWIIPMCDRPCSKGGQNGPVKVALGTVAAPTDCPHTRTDRQTGKSQQMTQNFINCNNRALEANDIWKQGYFLHKAGFLAFKYGLPTINETRLNNFHEYQFTHIRSGNPPEDYQMSRRTFIGKKHGFATPEEERVESYDKQ